MPGRYGHGLRTDRSPALDIPRRVTDHINPLGWKLDAMPLQSPCLREFSQLVAVVVIIRKGTELEKIPHTIVRELDLRAACEISRKQG